MIQAPFSKSMGYRSNFRSYSRSHSKHSAHSSHSKYSNHSKSRFKPKSSKRKEHYVYTLNLKGGKKYVGYTSNLDKRMDQHFSGHGSAVTRECEPVSVHSVTKCRSKQKAKNAERIVYHNMKNYHGLDKVRGAGNTKRFSLSQGAGSSSSNYNNEAFEQDDDSEEYASDSGDSVAVEEDEDLYASDDSFDSHEEDDD